MASKAHTTIKMYIRIPNLFTSRIYDDIMWLLMIVALQQFSVYNFHQLITTYTYKYKVFLKLCHKFCIKFNCRVSWGIKVNWFGSH